MASMSHQTGGRGSAYVTSPNYTDRGSLDVCDLTKTLVKGRAVFIRLINLHATE
jgi:hypothetical protein